MRPLLSYYNHSCSCVFFQNTWDKPKWTLLAISGNYLAAPSVVVAVSAAKTSCFKSFKHPFPPKAVIVPFMPYCFMWAWKLIKQVRAISSRLKLGDLFCLSRSLPLQTVYFTQIHTRLRYCNATLPLIRVFFFPFAARKWNSGTWLIPSHFIGACVKKINAAWKNSERSRRCILIGRPFVCGSLCSDPAFCFYLRWSSSALPAAWRWSAGVCYRLGPFSLS